MSTKISIRDNAIHLSPLPATKSYKVPSNVYTSGVARGENFESDFVEFTRQLDYLSLSSVSSRSFTKTGDYTGTVSLTITSKLGGIRMLDAHVVWDININPNLWTMQYRLSITAPNTSLNTYKTKLFLRKCGELYTAKIGHESRRVIHLIHGVYSRRTQHSLPL